jgi:carboxylate-amine ligase
MATLVEEILDLIAEDAQFFDAVAEVGNARDMLARGTSSERQRAVFTAARDTGQTEAEALQSVVRHLIEEYHADL